MDKEETGGSVETPMGVSARTMHPSVAVAKSHGPIVTVQFARLADE